MLATQFWLYCALLLAGHRLICAGAPETDDAQAPAELEDTAADDEGEAADQTLATRDPLVGKVRFTYAGGLLARVSIETTAKFERLLRAGKEGKPIRFRPFVYNGGAEARFEAGEVCTENLAQLVRAILRPLFHPFRIEGQLLQVPPMFRKGFVLYCSRVKGEFRASPARFPAACPI